MNMIQYKTPDHRNTLLHHMQQKLTNKKNNN